jgi:O-antigen/teichoic acid export membrane protein
VVQPSLLELMKKDSTNRMILLLSSSNVVSNLLTIIAGFLVARWVLPEDLGSFNAFTIVSGYIVLAQLGIPSALGRELPFRLGQGNKNEAYEYASTAQYWQKLLGVLVLVLGAASCIVAYLLGNGKFAAGSLTLGVISWQVLYVNKYLKVLYRTNRDFNWLSLIKVINALFAFGSIVFVWKFGFYGLCIRAILSAITDFLLTYKWRPIRVKASWRPLQFKQLMRTGLPMYAVANIYGLWPLVQRTLVLALGGTEALGLFALALMAENSMLTVSSSINNVLYPQMASLWGSGSSVGEIMRSIYKPVFTSMLLLLVALPVGWVLLPIFVETLLPNYIPGIVAAQWMLIVGVLEPTTAISNIYNVMKNQRDRLLMYLTGIFCWAITIYGLHLVFGFSLLIFPVGMVVAFLIMFLFNLLHVRRNWRATSINVG